MESSHFHFFFVVQNNIWKLCTSSKQLCYIPLVKIFRSHDSSLLKWSLLSPQEDMYYCISFTILFLDNRWSVNRWQWLSCVTHGSKIQSSNSQLFAHLSLVSPKIFSLLRLNRMVKFWIPFSTTISIRSTIFT